MDVIQNESGPACVLAKQVPSIRSSLGRRPGSPRYVVEGSPAKCTSHCCHIQAQQSTEIKRLRDQLIEMQLLYQSTSGEKDVKNRIKKIPRSVSPAVFSLTDEGAKERSLATSMGRHVSIATDKVLRSIPKKLPNRVAERVSEAFVNPLKAIQYLNSFDFSVDLIAMANQIAAVFENESRCVPLQSPVYVIGDIHGNLSDLKFFSDNLWRLGIGLTAGHFLFLGDYVDRGLSSLECIAYLFAQKIMHPHKITMLRGNHETRAVNGWEDHYGAGCFLTQCKKRFGNDVGTAVWHQINHAFDCMPLSAVIDDDIFCVHGGIPRPLDNERQMESIEKIPRVASFDTLSKGASSSAIVNEETALIQMSEEMLWADPASEEQEPFLDKHGFGKSARGGNSICFGNVAIDSFLIRHNYSYIIRAHEACSQGIHLSKSARVVTVFSTSKDHGLGKRAKCGCLLVDRDRILILNRSHKYKSGFVRRRSSLQGESLSSTTSTSSRRTGMTTDRVGKDQGNEDSTDDEVDDAKAMSPTEGLQLSAELGDNNQDES